MCESDSLTDLSANADVRTAQSHRLVQKFYDIATAAYLDNWGVSFHLPPFTPGQTLQQACVAQEQQLAGNFRAGQRILDAGCGVGGPARTIAASVAGLHITGVTLIQEQVDLAAEYTRTARLAEQITFVTADFNRLPFPDHFFDGAYTFDALCHSPDKATTYRELHRVLAPGATFVGTDWMHADGLTASDYARWIEPVCRYSALPDLRSPAGTAELLHAAGFTVHHCHDLAAGHDLSPNWDLFDQSAASIVDYSDPRHRYLHQHCVTTADAGRAGAFTIGAWTATA
ncbi:methyltransferase domain-containing protein [Nocardia sp. NPDC051570]|uniref:methyltransferase domain-containing protein n=1 Tax=Nocardia sp. NPDC051570 TaxID=3364324 RepID=UPI0037BDBD6D